MLAFDPPPQAPRDPSSSPTQAEPSRSSLPDGARASTHPGLTRARLRRLLSYYRPHLPMLAADLACAVLVSATALALPLCANVVTKRLTVAGDPSEVLGPILLGGAVMLGLLVAQTLASYVVDFRGHLMGARMEAALRRDLFEHCQRLSFGFHDRTRTGQLMSRITNDSFDVSELYHHGPEDLAIAVLKFAGVLAVLAWLDGPLMLLILAVIPLALGLALRFGQRMNRALRLSNERIAFVNERVEDSLGGVRVAQSFANEALEAQRFEVENTLFLDSRRAVYRGEALFSGSLDAFPQLVTALIITAGAWRVVQGSIDVPDLLTFLLCVGLLLDPVQRVANLVRLWQAGYTGFSRMAEVLEVQPDIQDPPRTAPLGQLTGAIAFEGVGFRYDEDGPHVLRDLSLSIRPGEFVALVGPSGAGKSTLCSLIPRFYDVTEGRVLVDGHDVREVVLASLRRAVGLVQQEVYLFAGTVAENIRYGRPDASDAEVEAAARAADAHDFIMALPRGYETEVGQRGVRLSGGQRQRLTIARAFLKDPAILIFDEATSALDTDSEKAVQEGLAALAKGRTTIVIAHRLSTIRRADRILVLTEDGIVEDGTHDDLLACGGVYARLRAGQARI